MIADTSLLSYIELAPELGERQKIIYDAIKHLGEATDYEITIFLDKRDPNYVRPRRKELYNLGIIRCVGKRVCAVTKRTVYVWSIKKMEW